MKSFLATISLGASLSAGALAQPLPIYENFGQIIEPPQIDAVAFANYGDFSVFSTLPFDFQSTKFFTNRGTMSGTPGFRFATASSTNRPFEPATGFLNDVGATITAGDVISFPIFIDTGTPVVPSLISRGTIPSFLLISADNIVNKGYLVAGGSGLLEVVGKNVDLSRSGLGIGRLELTATHFVTDSNFFPDPGIYDNYWAITNQFDMQPGNLLQIARGNTNANTPVFAMTNSPTSQFPSFDQFGVTVGSNRSFAMLSVMTNAGGADPETGRITNIYRQAAFIEVSDTNLAIDIKWAPSAIVTNPFQTAIISISLADTNVVTGEPELSTLFLKDLLASWTNYVVLTNLQTLPLATLRPATFELSRNPPLELLDAGDGNATLFPTFYFDAADTNAAPVVTNIYAAYEAEIDSLASRPPNVPGLQITDFPGRIEIEAENLDLTRTRLRGSSVVAIKTPNLISSRGVQVDSENVVYDLGVPNGTMSLQGVAKERVVRLNGPLKAWSAIWTNNMGTLMTNQVDDGQGNMTNVVTNVVTEIDYHMLIVDATGLTATKPVITHGFFSKANEVVISDPLTVVGGFRIDAESLILNNRLTLLNTVTNWVSTNVPNLKAFTSKGDFSVMNLAYFGYDTSAGYQSFTNLGTISANGILIRSGAVLSSGTLTSRVDGIRIESQSAQFENARTLAAGDLEISGTDLRFAASTNTTLGRLTLNARNSLSDTGEGANNLFTALAGFRLPVKPALGDLLGTTIHTIGPRFAPVEHIWAGEDRGPDASGFQNNAAIGQLVLDGDRDVTLTFRGPDAKNAMYVDLLEFAGWVKDNPAEGLALDPNFTIYYNESNIPEDELDEIFEGRVVQVDFAGTSSFVDVPVRSGGSVVQMERIVRMSPTMDSDGDGIANAYDAYPLDYDAPLALQGTGGNNQTTIQLSWVAEPQVDYVIEYTTNLGSPSWQVLSTVANSETLSRTVSVNDTISGNHAQRYYRVRVAD
ncbi:MAG: hypothetical protein AB9869_32285 [Verrucomicrobiia bacterium]